MRTTDSDGMQGPGGDPRGLGTYRNAEVQTILGVPLETGERVLFFHKNGDKNELFGWRPIVRLIGTILLGTLGLWVAAAMGSRIVLVALGIIALASIIGVAYFSMLKPRGGQVVTDGRVMTIDGRVMTIDGKGVLTWLPMWDVLDLEPVRLSAGRRGEFLGTANATGGGVLGKTNPDYWRYVLAIKVVSHSGIVVLLPGSRATELGPLLAKCVEG